MNFRRPKQEVIMRAESIARSTLQHTINDIKYNGYSNSQMSMFDQLEYGISSAIGQAIRSIVEDTYTDEEFEEDLMLRDKT